MPRNGCGGTVAGGPIRSCASHPDYRRGGLITVGAGVPPAQPPRAEALRGSRTVPPVRIPTDPGAR